MPERACSKEILEEMKALYELHQKTQTDPLKCREFNSRASIFLDRMETLRLYTIADKMMDILGGCSPKDFSHCDNHQQTKSALERLMERFRDIMK
ncbi:MAG: hypothetical protein LUQ38_04170 [Methanotrichaceae archaeon]|nr:hypothetical protein [Methanotrichaceae archaeon]